MEHPPYSPDSIPSEFYSSKISLSNLSRKLMIGSHGSAHSQDSLESYFKDEICSVRTLWTKYIELLKVIPHRKFDSKKLICIQLIENYNHSLSLVS